LYNKEATEEIYFSRTVVHSANNDLFFGLRGAGSSFAIVTEFLYRINKEPETR
jgi:hypothetical protein